MSALVAEGQRFYQYDLREVSLDAPEGMPRWRSGAAFQQQDINQ